VCANAYTQCLTLAHSKIVIPVPLSETNAKMFKLKSVARGKIFETSCTDSSGNVEDLLAKLHCKFDRWNKSSHFLLEELIKVALLKEDSSIVFQRDQGYFLGAT